MKLVGTWSPRYIFWESVSHLILGKCFPSTWKVIWTDNGSKIQALNDMNNISCEKNEFRRCICPSIYAFDRSNFSKQQINTYIMICASYILALLCLQTIILAVYWEPFWFLDISLEYDDLQRHHTICLWMGMTEPMLRDYHLSSLCLLL